MGRTLKSEAERKRKRKRTWKLWADQNAVNGVGKCKEKGEKRFAILRKFNRSSCKFPRRNKKLNFGSDEFLLQWSLGIYTPPHNQLNHVAPSIKKFPPNYFVLIFKIFIIYLAIFQLSKLLANVNNLPKYIRLKFLHLMCGTRKPAKL